MRIKQLLVFGSLALLGFASCKKGNGNKPAGKRDTTVYVIGNSSLGANVWKNGASSPLPNLTTTSRAKAITVSGSDVYIAGISYSSQGGVTAIYWKNNVITKLTDDVTLAQGIAIAVSLGNVYVAGSIGVNNILNACYWKNGVLITLPGVPGYTEAAATGIALNGPDVYVCGYLRKNGGNAEAVYWKNGVIHEITDGSAVGASAVSIAVKSNSVYVAYYVVVDYNADELSYYLKDGVATQVSGTLPYTEIRAMTTDANNVYLAGQTYSASHAQTPAAAVWKNDAVQILPTVKTYIRISGITTDGSDVYVSGVDDEPVYWKNGVEVKLFGSADYRTSGIAVVVR